MKTLELQEESNPGPCSRRHFVLQPTQGPGASATKTLVAVAKPGVSLAGEGSRVSNRRICFTCVLVPGYVTTLQGTMS